MMDDILYFSIKTRKKTICNVPYKINLKKCKSVDILYQLHLKLKKKKQTNFQVFCLL